MPTFGTRSQKSIDWQKDILFLPFPCNFQGEIDAQEDSFKATSQFGQSLISAGHYASEEVKEKVTSNFSHQIIQ